MMSQDYLIPFMINEAPVRGRIVRLNDVVDTVLKRHDYPPIVSNRLAEALTVAAMLASNLKSNGILTIQIQSKGAINLLVVDATHGGNLRGYAEFNEAALQTLDTHNMSSLFGEGYLAITLDADEGNRYQGVVPLEGASITDAVQRYFTQSQQLEAQFHVAVGSQVIAGEKDEHWIAGGVYIEHMPEDGTQADADAWPRAQALLNTVQDNELLSVELDLADLLHMLFHEDGVWVYEPQALTANCRCSREKIEKTLKGMGHDAIDEMVMDGKISVNCQFCNGTQIFSPDELKVA